MRVETESRVDAGAPRRGAPAEAAPETIGALDLGTNNCRLLIASVEGAGFRVVESFSRIVRLGEGLAATGRLSEAAMARTIDALGACASRLSARRVARARLVATEACRAASNGPEFVARVRRETGLALEIIGRDAEARLAAEGCSDLLAPDAAAALVFDIGGGSTELALVAPCPAAGPGIVVRDWESLPLGVVTLSEARGGRVVTPESYAAMRADAAARLAPFARRVASAEAAPGFHLIGTSGTVTTAAALHLRLPRYDRRAVDGISFDRAALAAVIGRLLATDHEGRAGEPCVTADRADLVLPGCAILEAVLEAFPNAPLRVADRGLREGLLRGLLRGNGAAPERFATSRAAETVR